jgi:photosystem II stability/assembly factor-like uncharacterized protein
VTWTSRSIADRALYGVACHGNLRGWAAGAGGYVAHTEDGGAKWAPQVSHLARDLRTIQFGTPMLGVVAGDGGALAITKDGGTTWVPALSGTASTLRSSAVAGDVGVLIVVGDHGTALRSADAGATWRTVEIPGAGDLRGVATDPGAHLVLAVDSLGTVWSSDDGAASFTRDAWAGAPLESVSMDEHGTLAVAAGQGGTVLVREGGTWQAVTSGTTVDLHATLVIDDASRIYVAGEGGTLLTRAGTSSEPFVAKQLGTTQAIYGLEDL